MKINIVAGANQGNVCFGPQLARVVWKRKYYFDILTDDILTLSTSQTKPTLSEEMELKKDHLFMEILILITFVQLCLSAKNKLVLRPVGREYQAVVPKLSGGKYYGVSYVIQVHFFLFPKRP